MSYHLLCHTAHGTHYLINDRQYFNNPFYRVIIVSANEVILDG